MSANSLLAICPLELTLNITVEAPFLVHGTEPGAFGIDAVVLRNGLGKPTLPGTLLVGKIREAWAGVPALQEDIDTLFGRQAKGYQPAPGRLVECDLVCEESESAEIVHRVAIDAETGAGKLGHLLMIEQPWRMGQRLEFTGIWHVFGTQTQGNAWAASIEKTLQWIGQVGGEASVGFGQIKAVSVTASPGKTQNIQLEKKRYKVLLSSDEPVLIPQFTSVSDNLFVGTEVIPGAAVKGAIALSLNTLGLNPSNKVAALREAIGPTFDSLRVSHFSPFASGSTSEPLPLSIVEIGEKYFDVAQLDGPHLIDGDVPAFNADWKGRGPQITDLDQSQRVVRELRVRTAMENGTALESALFAHEALRCSQGWAGTLDCSELEDDMLNRLNEALSGNLLYLGKLKTPFRLTVLSVEEKAMELPACKDGDMVRIMLKTKAVLTANNRNFNIDLQSLHHAYAQFWAEASDGALDLQWFFADQTQIGGAFAANFRSHGRYIPWLVTEPGSVFTLRVRESAKAREALKGIAQRGLPITRTVKDAYGLPDQTLWKHMPFLAENGYGEVAVNPSIGGAPLLDPDDSRLEKIHAKYLAVSGKANQTEPV